MLDFMLTKTGDIVISENTRKNSSINLFFNLNDKKPIKLSFYIDDERSISENNGINISFDIEKDDIDNEKHSLRVLDFKTSLKQMIKNAIYTTKEELKINKSFGSRMEEVKHNKLFDQDTINKAERYLYEALETILPNSKIEVYPDYKTKPKFYQGLRIVVINEDEILFNDIV